ncbi:methyl-accepting chemotaxis protein [Chitinimonas arctica]|uniref:Methyl-accepting chemotaxis protein n=1 Tax=Chitinimonas arctica TaxID=2594795 RepID=A0A516SBJ4_9NEIS|nr:methyl-accepting chemotaxis protein [Chitinimonas arctica]QDQ25521.1 methyl-accepting chemotaxis protein [Chitinimonas arctica]
MLQRGGLGRKLMIPVLLAGVAMLCAVMAILAHIRERTVEAAGMNTAQALASQIVTLRSFYTAEIGPRAKKAGMKLNFDFFTADNTLPLPATLVKTLGESITKDHPGMAIRLYSRHPFPNRTNERYDEFEMSAIAALEKAPKVPQTKMEKRGDKLYARYAVADIMKEGCVACHNSRPDSPKKDWKVGDVRGVVAVTVPVDQVAGQINKGIGSVGLAVLAGFFAISAVTIMATRRIAGTVHELAERAGQVESSGDFTLAMPVRGNDEIAGIAKAFNSLLNHFRAVISEIREDANQVLAESVRLADAAAKVSQSSMQQSDLAAAVSASVEQVSTSIGHVSSEAHEAADQSAATSRLAREGGEVAQEAAGEMDRVAAAVETMAAVVGQLGQRSAQISVIANTIRDIADQTNLLALNAAIEAARAGEQGRGFAVVADEVRKLAERTSVATREIASTIDAIQQESRSAGDAMAHHADLVSRGSSFSRRAAESLQQINTAANTAGQHIGEIATATDQQNTASHQIARNMEQIAMMTEGNAQSVAIAASSADKLRSLAGRLQDTVNRFKV